MISVLTALLNEIIFKLSTSDIDVIVLNSDEFVDVDERYNMTIGVEGVYPSTEQISKLMDCIKGDLEDTVIRDSLINLYSKVAVYTLKNEVADKDPTIILRTTDIPTLKDILRDLQSYGLKTRYIVPMDCVEFGDEFVSDVSIVDVSSIRSSWIDDLENSTKNLIKVSSADDIKLACISARVLNGITSLEDIKYLSSLKLKKGGITELAKSVTVIVCDYFRDTASEAIIKKIEESFGEEIGEVFTNLLDFTAK